MVVGPLGIVRIDGKTAPLRPIFGENQFSPADEAVLIGLVVRKCHFDEVTLEGCTLHRVHPSIDKCTAHKISSFMSSEVALYSEDALL